MSAEEKCIEKFQDRLEAWDYIGALECLDDPVWTPWLEKNAALELTPVVITYITGYSTRIQRSKFSSRE